jgi:hypothetical protein
VLDGASTEDLRQARDEIRGVLQWIDAAKALLAAAMGRAPDPQLLEAATRPSHREGPALVVAWLSMMSLPGARQKYDAALSTIRDVTKGTLEPADAMKTNSTHGPIDQSSEESSNE